MAEDVLEDEIIEDMQTQDKTEEDFRFFLIFSHEIMDRYGRKYAIILSLSVIALGLGAIPFTTNLTSMLLAAIITGFGNGIGSGTMLTLGADLAPPESKGEFLGTWLLIGNLGFMIGPLMVGGIASILLLGQTTWVMAGMGLLGIFTFARFVPETLNKDH